MIESSGIGTVDITAARPIEKMLSYNQNSTPKQNRATLRSPYFITT
jgi:hypothetical protein